MTIVEAAVDPDLATGGVVRSRKGIVIAWARRLMVLAILVVAGYELFTQWHSVSQTLFALPWQSVTLSFVVVFVGIWLCPVVWQVVLSGLGSPVRVREAAKIYLVGQLGKYVPGAVWAFLVQMELAKAAGVSRARSFTATLIAAGIGIVASMFTALLALPAFLSGDRQLLWLFLLLPVGLVFLYPKLLTWLVSRVLRLLRRAPLSHPLRAGVIARAVGLGVAVYVIYGVHLWLLVSSLGHSLGVKGLLVCIGAMGMGMTAGQLAIILPSGLGARELGIVTALATVLPHGQAFVLVLVSRLMFTIADLASAGASTLVAYLGTRGVRSAVAGTPESPA